MKGKPTQREKDLVRIAQARARRSTYDQFRSFMRGFIKPAENSELLRWKFNKMLREKKRGKQCFRTSQGADGGRGSS